MAEIKSRGERKLKIRRKNWNSHGISSNALICSLNLFKLAPTMKAKEGARKTFKADEEEENELNIYVF